MPASPNLESTVVSVGVEHRGWAQRCAFRETGIGFRRMNKDKTRAFIWAIAGQCHCGTFNLNSKPNHWLPWAKILTKDPVPELESPFLFAAPPLLRVRTGFVGRWGQAGLCCCRPKHRPAKSMCYELVVSNVLFHLVSLCLLMQHDETSENSNCGRWVSIPLLAGTATLEPWNLATCCWAKLG